MLTDRLYDRLFPSCSTINQLNRVHILLENRMTPVEAAAVSAHVRRRYDDGAVSRTLRRVRARIARTYHQPPLSAAPSIATPRALRDHAVMWGANVQRQLGLAPTPTPSPFTRRWTRGGATYYQAADRPAATLAIGLTGNVRRLMMPTPLFLQHLHSFSADLLMLDVARGTTFVEGVRGYSADFPGTVDWLREFIPRHGASQVVTVGTSGGAFPAVLAGLALCADSVLAVGTRTRKVASYSRFGSEVDLASVVRQYGTPGHRPSVHLMHGDESALDAQFARSLAALLDDARLVTVEGAGHSCLYDLAERQELEGTLAATLFQPSAARGRMT